MKKFLAILLAMMLVMVSVAALATTTEGGSTEGGTATEGGTTEGGTTEGETTTGKTDVAVSIDPDSAKDEEGNDDPKAANNPTDPVVVEITKSITATKDDGYVYDNTDRHPEVKLNFTAVQKSVELSTETTAPTVTFDELTIAENADSGKLKIHLPSYKAVGVYTYTVTETATNIAGFHEAEDLELKVTVQQNTTTGNLEIAGIAVRQANVKTDDIENIYKSGRLKITKIVDGTMGDRTKPFPITITLNAPTGKTVKSTVTYKINGTGEATNVTFDSTGKAEIKVQLKHNEYVEIANIPEDVTYFYSEDSTIKHLNSADEEQNNKEAYMVEGEIASADQLTITVAELTSKEIKNTKDTTPDTGITLETLPYVLMMALAMMGLVALKLRKREEY